LGMQLDVANLRKKAPSNSCPPEAPSRQAGAGADGARFARRICRC
jgi:hypothetical protein